MGRLGVCFLLLALAMPAHAAPCGAGPVDVIMVRSWAWNRSDEYRPGMFGASLGAASNPELTRRPGVYLHETYERPGFQRSADQPWRHLYSRTAERWSDWPDCDGVFQYPLGKETMLRRDEFRAAIGRDDAPSPQSCPTGSP
jgi:hypothetical protein